ncbi:relaxase/mobilization nuclease domain-containing protein [Pseudorhodoferax sp. LjRoot39]|uniref:relaxase/mobilization nuclease domain-containing protein n=1 Tax=Pseudorhodoferax sp. LjRoot39 TaxID=3342328 RepID=UPI003ED000C7
MIINGGSRSNWRFFAKHLVKTTENERVEITEIRGLAADTVLEAFREMDALASGTRCTNFFYHANLNARVDEVLTPEQWDQAVDALEHNLGLDGHSRFVVEHHKEGRTHRHVVWSRIDPDSMTAVSDSKNFAVHERTARDLEKAFGHKPTQGAHGHDGTRPRRRPKNWEKFRGHESGIDPEALGRHVTALWQRSDSGLAFAHALDESGLMLCRGDRRNYCLIDQAGEVHSLARRLEGVKAADLRKRLVDLEHDGLPTAAEAKARVAARSPSEEPTEQGRAVEPEAAPACEVLESPAPAPVPVLDAAPLPEGSSALDSFAHQVNHAMRSNGGDPVHGDGLSWLERSITVLTTARDSMVDWVRGHWQDLIHHSRDRDQEQER